MSQPTNLKGKEYIKSIPIPDRVASLPRDERGYPIPYFIPIVDGKENFKYMDAPKQLRCATQRICMICGQKLLPKQYWYITGPIGRKNFTVSDPAMHEECARYSLAVCPHMHYEKADRTTGADESPPEIVVLAKPPQVFLIHAQDYVIVKHKSGYILSEFVNVVYEECWSYVDGILVKDPNFVG